MKKKKKHLLEKSGYNYYFPRMIYLNHDTKKMFSVDFIASHALKEIQEKITENKIDNGQWVFYFNQELSEAAKTEILSDFQVEKLNFSDIPETNADFWTKADFNGKYR